jgi:dUTP pyrophosphatase
MLLLLEEGPLLARLYGAV